MQTVAPISYGTPYAGLRSRDPQYRLLLHPVYSSYVNASGLGLQGLQFNFITPRTLSSNLTFQYALTRTLSAQIAYVITDGMNLQTGIRQQQRNQILPVQHASLTNVTCRSRISDMVRATSEP